MNTNDRTCIEFKNISKIYSFTQACHNINLSIQRGEIHSIIGENGAGKSTLMKLLGGLEKPSSGQLYIDGQIYEPQSALDAYKNKIAFIHQHFVLAQQLTAFENILLSSSAAVFSLKTLNKIEIRHRAIQILKKFNWNISLDHKVENISVGDQQRLEILKALLLEPDIFIFDEPTAVLAPQESIELLEFLLLLKQQNKTILLISHKLNEIKKVSDRISVLRKGHLILTTENKDTNIEQLAEHMIGRKSQKVQNIEALNIHANNPNATTDTTADSASHSTADAKIAYQIPDSPISIHSGEIFGVAGIEGNGQTEWIQKLLIDLNQKKIHFGDITEDRIPLSIFDTFSILDHVLIRYSKKFSKFGFILKQKAHTFTVNLLQKWDVRPAEPQMKVQNLSGGNQQKFFVGRELAMNPDILIAAHPTRGVDLGAQEMIQNEFIHFSKKLNKTLILISADLDEILSLSDRYIILHKGKAFGPFRQNQLNESEIGQYMTGSKT